MKRLAMIAMVLGWMGVGPVDAQVVEDATVTGIGKVGLDKVSAGLSYFTRADGENFSCYGSSAEDKQRMTIPAAFTADQRKSYLSLVLTAKSMGASVSVKFNRNGAGGICEIMGIELQH